MSEIIDNDPEVFPPKETQPTDTAPVVEQQEELQEVDGQAAEEEKTTNEMEKFDFSKNIYKPEKNGNGIPIPDEEKKQDEQTTGSSQTGEEATQRSQRRRTITSRYPAEHYDLKTAKRGKKN